jgi:hypothetical protein
MSNIVLHAFSRLVLTDHIKKRCERTMEQVVWLTRLEAKPFTLNEHYHCDYRDKFMAHYKGWRQNDRNSTLMTSIRNHGKPPMFPVSRGSTPTGIDKIISGYTEVGVHGIKPADIPKILPSDPMEPALIIMADVRAYFQGLLFCCTALTLINLAVRPSVAYKRFTDNIPLAIDLELIRGLKDGIDGTLYRGLGVSGPDGHRICKELVQEHPNVSARREELRKKLERLNTASQELVHLDI